jgi:hypothetical protein
MERKHGDFIQGAHTYSHGKACQGRHISEHVEFKVIVQNERWQALELLGMLSSIV